MGCLFNKNKGGNNNTRSSISRMIGSISYLIGGIGLISHIAIAIFNLIFILTKNNISCNIPLVPFLIVASTMTFVMVTVTIGMSLYWYLCGSTTTPNPVPKCRLKAIEQYFQSVGLADHPHRTNQDEWLSILPFQRIKEFAAPARCNCNRPDNWCSHDQRWVPSRSTQYWSLTGRIVDSYKQQYGLYTVWSGQITTKTFQCLQFGQYIIGPIFLLMVLGWLGHNALYGAFLLSKVADGIPESCNSNLYAVMLLNVIVDFIGPPLSGGLLYLGYLWSDGS